MNNIEKTKEKAIVAGVNLDKRDYDRDESSLEELYLLAETAGFEPEKKLLQHRDKIDSACYIGTGKAKEIRRLSVQNKVDVILFDFELSPVQIRNLERLVKCRIISRTELILEIFEKRAKTKEAKLQVELATLLYSLPRLRHMWPHLNRIEGGIGTRGPGEKQIEMDRRRIAKRISKIKKDLTSVKTHRMVMRKNRKDKNRVALVGYTNAGKSSLLNTLSHSSLFTENKLFATLDPATREVWLGEGIKVMVTDTVGFIKRLPHTLIASFKSTLEELKDSDLLLHVVDISDGDVIEKIHAVNEVLYEISAENMPVLYIFNKADLLPIRTVKASILNRYKNHVLVSSKTGENIEDLRKILFCYFTDNLNRELGVVNDHRFESTKLIEEKKFVSNYKY